MTALFVPFSDRWPTGSSWIVGGLSPDFAETISTSTAGDLDLGEMANPGAGLVRRCEAGPRGLLIEAEVSGKLAIAKVAEGIYRGFGVIATRDAHGDTVIQRIALVDAPDVMGRLSKSDRDQLAKRSIIAAPSWAALHFEKGLKMNNTSRKQEENPYARIVVDGTAANNKLALDLIKYCRAQPMKAGAGASDKEFFQWLQRNNR